MFHIGTRFFAATKMQPKRKSAPAGPADARGKFQVRGPPVFSKSPAWSFRWPKISEPIQDLVGPEPLEPMQRLVQRRELLVRDAADLLHGLDVLLIQRVDDAADFLSLRGQANADRAAIDARPLMIEEAEFDQLLQIVGNVGAEVIAARAQLARGQFLVADVVEQERLHGIDIRAAAAIELILDDVEQTAMQPLDQRQRFQIERLHGCLAGSALSGFNRRCNGFHHDTSPVVVLSTYSTKLLSRL